MTSSMCLSPQDKTFHWKTNNLQIHLIETPRTVTLQTSTKIQSVPMPERGLKRKKRKERKRRQKERKAILASSKKQESEGPHARCVLVCVCPEQTEKDSKKNRKKARKAKLSDCVLVSGCSQEPSHANAKGIPRSKKRRICKRNKSRKSSFTAVKTADVTGSPATLSSEVSILRLASSNSPQSPSVSRSRSPPPATRSPPRTPRSSRGQNPRSPRLGSPSPVRDHSQVVSPRQSRIDTPTRRSRVQAQRATRVQYPCRNSGCDQRFQLCRQRNIHENSSCSRRSQHQVQYSYL